MKTRRFTKAGLASLLALIIAVALLTGYVPNGDMLANKAYAGPGTIKAGEEDCAYICAELGLLRGEGDGVTDAYLAKTTQRIQAAYLTLRLVGKEAEAEKFPPTDNFNDVGHIYDGGQRRTAYLKANKAKYGWEGDGTNRLMPNDNVTAQQFYKVLLTVLGYRANVDYPYEDTLSYADYVAGMKECRYISGALINDEIAIMMVEALLANIRDETYTLAEFLAEEGVIDYDKCVELGVISKTDVIDVAPATPTPSPTPTPPPVTPGTLAVNSIGATNFAEIDIVFNQKINKDSVDRNYIKINGGPLLNADHVRVLDDGVTLRLYRETGYVTQQGQTVKVSVSKVKSENNTLEMAAIVDREIAIYDSQPPTLAEVIAYGLKRVKLVFSEPLRQSDSALRNNATYKFNGRVYSASEPAVSNGREVYLSFSTPLDAGENKLTIDKNRLYDLAGFPIYDVVDFAFLASEDKEAPSVVSVEAWREKVVAVFSKEVRDQVKLYWLDGSVRRSAQAGVKDPFNRNKVTFNFPDGQYLPISATEIVIESIVDMNGNAGSDYRTTVSPKYDTERPAVVSIESPGANEIIVGFSKPVKLGAANNNRFILRNSNNTIISVNVQSYIPTGASSPDQRYIRLTGTIPAGIYTLTVANVEDTTAQANRSAETVHSVTVADKTPPKVLSVSAKIPESKVVILFDKTLDWSTAADVLNYQYFVPARGHVELPPGTTVVLEVDEKTVVLAFPIGGWTVAGTMTPNAFPTYIASNASNELRLLNIKDKNGNAMEPTLIDVPGTSEVAAKLLAAAYAVSPSKIMLRFEAAGTLPITAAAQDFIVRAGSSNLGIKSMGYHSINAAQRELYIELEGVELNSGGKYGSSGADVTVAMVAPAQVGYTKTALGTPLEIAGNATVTVTDNIKTGLHEALRGSRAAAAAPNLSGVSYPALTGSQIMIVFDELVQVKNAADATQLKSIVDVVCVSQPNVAINTSLFSIEAYGNTGNNVTGSNTVSTRMIIITLDPPIAEDVSVSVRANTLWDGNKDAGNNDIMNSAFASGFLAQNY